MSSEHPRYRCNSCGNVTRFDVTTIRRTRAFHHYTLGGDLTIEDEELLAEVCEDVRCRWCDLGDRVEVVRPILGGASATVGPDCSDEPRRFPGLAQRAEEVS